MKQFFERAISNITTHGDTDIFPLPIENHVFFDKTKDVVELRLDLDHHFSDRLAQFPPSNYSALVPVSYDGFRWATQIDPLWNAYFLGVVLSIAEEIELVRIPKSDLAVFSYRYQWDNTSSDLFDKDYNWRTFMDRSLSLSTQHSFVVSCDISEFYPRLNHHRLENALKHLGLKGNQPSKIMAFLSNFSGTYSFGLPIGGPAARILSELLLNQIDRLLRLEGIHFCRFADDYHLFADGYDQAFNNLVYLSEKLLHNQGLHLQKAKTRIMSGQEFAATSPLGRDDEKDTVPRSTKDASAVPSTLRDQSHPTAPNITKQSHNLMRFIIHFDPYSPTAAHDFEALRAELRKFDVISLLKSELAKSRIHISLSRKIVSAIRFIDDDLRDDAIISLVSNETLLYPIYANILLVAKALYEDLTEETKTKINMHIRDLLRKRSHVLQVELNLAYAIRLLSCTSGPDNEEILNRLFWTTNSILIRRDIILAMSKWNAWYWLSNLKGTFRTLSPAERRAFVVASYTLRDEGDHWRQHITPELSPFERLVKTWASERVQFPGWSVPL